MPFLAWYERVNHFFVSLGFKSCESDHSIYVFCTEGNTLIVVVYVDDLVITSNNSNITFRLKRQLVDIFEMTNIVILCFFLGLHFLPLLDDLFISQYKCVMDLLHHLQMDGCKACATPYQSGVKLLKDCETPQVIETLYQ